MKDNISGYVQRHWLSVLILIAVSYFIWHIGPEIAIAKHVPLAKPSARFLLICGLILGWVIKILFFEEAAQPQAIPQQKNSAPQNENNTHLLQLQKRFRGAVEFLEKTVVDKHGTTVNLANLPWYLMIGPEKAGKTSLLAQSNINFILSKKFKKDAKMTPSDTCDWWVTRDLVLIDTPGHFFSHQAHAPAKTLWDGLTTELKAFHQLNGVVVVLNLPEVVKTQNAQQKSQFIQSLKQRMQSLREQFGKHLPFYFVITKCDLLPGFLEYFSECGQDELAQAWGISIPTLQDNEKLIDLFNHRFNALIKRMNKQLLWRLHQERNPNTRPFIKDFPLHIERLKEGINSIIKAIALPDLHLAGVYLTSATQTKQEENSPYIHEASTHLTQTQQSLHIMRAPSMPTKAYFVKQLILQGFLTASAHPAQPIAKEKPWHRKAAIAASIFVVSCAAILLGNDFQRSVHKAYSIQQDLSHYQLLMQQTTHDSDRLIKALPLLQALQQATIQSTKSYLSFYSKKSLHTAQNAYQQALQNIVLPALKNNFEEYLQNLSDKTPEQTYAVLKAYLLLKNNNPQNGAYVANILNQIAVLNLKKPELDQLANHINATLVLNKNLVLQDNLIEEARKQFSSLSSAEMGMIILKNMNDNNIDSTIDLGTNFGNPPIFVSKAILNHIPNAFTASHFNNIILHDSNIAAAETLNGNAVLGTAQLPVESTNIASLAAQIRSQYIANYVDIWESQIANIQPYTATNLKQIDGMIATLTSNNSPLLKLLQTIRDNTALQPILEMSPKIQALNHMLTTNGNNQQNALYLTFVNLRKLHSYLHPLINAKDLPKASFDAAALRMLNNGNDALGNIKKLADQSPEPLKNWLNTLADDSWHFILEDTSKYVEHAWETLVLPTYNGKIAVPTVNAFDLMQFLGHKGTLAEFYHGYLRPFVDDKTAPWEWRTVDNQKITFSSEALTKIQRAAALQHTLFPNTDNQFAATFLPIKPGKIRGALKTTLAQLELPQDLLQ